MERKTGRGETTVPFPTVSEHSEPSPLLCPTHPPGTKSAWGFYTHPIVTTTNSLSESVLGIQKDRLGAERQSSRDLVPALVQMVLRGENPDVPVPTIL